MFLPSWLWENKPVASLTLVINITAGKIFFLYLSEAFLTTLSLWKELDIVCNNAAVLDEDKWSKTLNTNLVKCFGILEVLKKFSSVMHSERK